MLAEVAEQCHAHLQSHARVHPGTCAAGLLSSYQTSTWLLSFAQKAERHAHDKPRNDRYSSVRISLKPGVTIKGALAM
jgi:hypothetical protein